MIKQRNIKRFIFKTTVGLQKNYSNVFYGPFLAAVQRFVCSFTADQSPRNAGLPCLFWKFCIRHFKLWNFSFPWSLRNKLCRDSEQSELLGILLQLLCFIPQKKDPNRRVSIHVQSRESGAEQEQRLPLHPPQAYSRISIHFSPLKVRHCIWEQRKRMAQGQLLENEQ